MKLVNPANKRKYTVIVVGTGLAGAARRRLAGGARLQREVLLLPGLAPPRALDRRAGRHQRRQELPERRRQRLPALLRHDQGRRLPRARGQRLPAGRGQREHHRPVRGAGRAVRARVRRAARQPLLRRRAGVAHLLRARPDRPAAPARRLSGAGAADRRGHGEDVSRARRCSTWSSSTARPRASSSATWSTGEIESHAGRRRGARRPAATATSSTSRPTPRAATSPRSGAPTSTARCFANPCYTQIHPDLHPGQPAITSRS